MLLIALAQQTKLFHQRDHRSTEEHFASCAVRVAPDLQLGPMCQRAQLRLVRNEVSWHFGLVRFKLENLAAEPDTRFDIWQKMVKIQLLIKV